MPRSSAIVLRSSSDASAEWRRFVAGLCFIEFYYQFATAGVTLWNKTHPGFRIHARLDPSESCYLIELSAGILRAIAFFFIGRALWRRKRSVSFWLICGILASLAMIGARIAQSVMDQGPLFGPYSVVGFWSRSWAMPSRCPGR